VNAVPAPKRRTPICAPRQRCCRPPPPDETPYSPSGTTRGVRRAGRGARPYVEAQSDSVSFQRPQADGRNRTRSGSYASAKRSAASDANRVLGDDLTLVADYETNIATQWLQTLCGFGCLLDYETNIATQRLQTLCGVWLFCLTLLSTIVPVTCCSFLQVD
jgi:hypothetical protein